jgi:cell division protein FtsQ
MASRTRTPVRPDHDVVDPVTRRSRRAFARREWARRWVTWKYVVAAVVLVGLVAGSLWLFLFSSVLAVKQVDVAGVDGLRPEQVRAAGAVSTGEPLARVDLDAVRTRVQALAEVRSAAVTRQWPDTIVIEVEERVAIAVVDIGGALRGLDREGVVFDDFRQAPPGLPRVETDTGAGREALQEAADVVSALPDDLAARADHVEVATVDQISLVLRDGRTVLWGSAEESPLKAEVLVALLEGPGRAFDVSVPGRPTFTP